MAGVAGIQQSHGPKIRLAGIQGKINPILQGEIFVGKFRQFLLQGSVDLIVLLPQNPD
jgi:hypothetical protein